MIDFLYYDTESGEQFFVEARNAHEAWNIVAENFDTANIKYCGSYTTAEAEILGYDTY